MIRYRGVEFVVSHHATKLVYHWPDKKRSRRLVKKLTRLRGPQVTCEPCAYLMADGRMAIHPVVYSKLRQQSDNAKGGDA